MMSSAELAKRVVSVRRVDILFRGRKSVGAKPLAFRDVGAWCMKIKQEIIIVNSGEKSTN